MVALKLEAPSSRIQIPSRSRSRVGHGSELAPGELWRFVATTLRAGRNRITLRPNGSTQSQQLLPPIRPNFNFTPRHPHGLLSGV